MDNMIEVRRLDDGSVITNLPEPLLIFHSKDGLDFGSNNPGTDDLALNMLHHTLIARGGYALTTLPNGQSVCQVALDLHERFALESLIYIQSATQMWRWSQAALMNWVQRSL